MYSFRDSSGPVDLAFTDRLGGVSAVPFDSLNLALVSDDDPGAVARNWRLVLDDFAPGVDVLADMRQVHGAEVCDAVAPRGPGEGPPECDGIVTDRPDVVLAVRVADCVPVLLADPVAGVVGAAHAGRLGVQNGVVSATVARMRGLGAGSVTAWVGPHVCGACYEVPEEMRAEVAAVEPAAAATTSWGTPALDLGAAVRAQLEREGVTVVDAARCTRESPDLYSHRRDGASAGRLAGLVRLRGAR
jgi:YfiH family protein